MEMRAQRHQHSHRHRERHIPREERGAKAESGVFEGQFALRLRHWVHVLERNWPVSAVLMLVAFVVVWLWKQL